MVMVVFLHVQVIHTHEIKTTENRILYKTKLIIYIINCSNMNPYLTGMYTL